MRTEGFALTRRSDGEWLARTLGASRWASAAVGTILIGAATIIVLQRVFPFSRLGVIVAAALGVVLLVSSFLREELRVSRTGIAHRRSWPFGSATSYPIDELRAIKHGRVELLIGARPYPGYRVWLEFRGAALPTAVVYERRLSRSPDAEAAGVAVANALASSLARQPERVGE